MTLQRALKFPIYLVNAFTLPGQHYTGNQAAVCLLDYDDDISDENKQRIATELNSAAVTTFISHSWSRSEDINHPINYYVIRWFTPKNEINFCGHATLAASKILFDRMKETMELDNRNATVKFETKTKGIFIATMDWSRSQISLDLPSSDTFATGTDKYEWLDELLDQILGSKDLKDLIVDVQYSQIVKYLLIRLKKNEEEIVDTIKGPKYLQAVTPNFEKLIEIKENNIVGGVIVTVEGSKLSGPNFYSRFFSPWNGVNEDDVCGSAHTILGPFWSKKLGIVDHLLAVQCSPRRSGQILCQCLGDRIKLNGNAYVIVRGELMLE